MYEGWVKWKKCYIIFIYIAVLSDVGKMNSVLLRSFLFFNTLVLKMKKTLTQRLRPLNKKAKFEFLANKLSSTGGLNASAS